MHFARKGPGGRRWSRWILPAAVVGVLASSLTVLLVVRNAGDACAAVGVAGLSGQLPGAGPLARVGETSGKATYYAVDGRGNCSFEPVGPGHYVAVGPSEYAGGAACGSYYEITGPNGTIRAKVTDQCPGCGPGHIDLSEEAFAAVGALSDGVIPVTYRSAADPTLSGPLTARVKEGASEYWLAIRFDQHGNALAGVEVKAGDSWLSLVRSEDNYWVKDGGVGAGPYAFRLVDSQGHLVTLEGIVLAPQQVQSTASWMYGASSASPNAASPIASPSTTPASSPAVVTSSTPSPFVRATTPSTPGHRC
jgi:expansin (peptidoglycan-binding protein)